MRLVSYDAGAGPRAGLLREGRVHDFWGEAFAHVREEDRTIDAVLRGDLLGRSSRRKATAFRSRGAAPTPGRRARQDRLHRAELPLPRRGAGHRAARDAHLLRQVRKRARRPGATVALPPWSKQGGLRGGGGVRDRPRGKDMPEERALEHVAGYMLLNDLSARDYQFKTPQWMPGKTFDGAAPYRPGARHRRRGRAGPTRSSLAAPERRGDAGGEHR